MHSILNHTISIAPMLDWSDRHYRYFMRQITQHSVLYSEMVVADAVLHGDLERLIGFNPQEQPIVAQLGGSDPHKLANSARKCQDYNYNEINLNVGCPSERVQSGSFGACLMRETSLVADCIRAMQDAVSIPITIKHRTGLDYDYNYNYLQEFVGQIANTGCNTFIVHARNAILKGLSPKANREIPPLRYDFVYQLKQDFPDLNIIINGGIKTHAEIKEHLKNVDGVMLGREAYYNPYLFSQMDELYYHNAMNSTTRSRKEIALSMAEYMHQMQNHGVKLQQITRHMIGLYHGCQHAKLWRSSLTTGMIAHNSLDFYLSIVEQMDE